MVWKSAGGDCESFVNDLEYPRGCCEIISKQINQFDFFCMGFVRILYDLL